LKLFRVGLLCCAMAASAVSKPAVAADDDPSLVNADHAMFGPDAGSSLLDGNSLAPNFTWTDSSGVSCKKSDLLRVSRAEICHMIVGTGLRWENSNPPPAIRLHTHKEVGIIQAQGGNLHILRLWVRRAAGWRLLVYQEVATGAPPSGESGQGECDNPCKTVPFEPRNEDEREVIRAYQDVERAVAARDSAAWGAHIADEFFAVTSNSNRPLDKAARMAGLDNQKVAGIAPFPLVSMRMFQFGDTMVMISRQQPEHGLPLHVTRVWFKRNGAWLEAYSYQTTIQTARR